MENTICLQVPFSHGIDHILVLPEGYTARKKKKKKQLYIMPGLWHKDKKKTSRECHNHKLQPIPDTKRKRKETQCWYSQC